MKDTKKFKKLSENRIEKFAAGNTFVGKFVSQTENDMGVFLVFETEKEIVNVPFYKKIEQHINEIKPDNYYLFDNIRMTKTKEKGQQFLNFDIFELAVDEYQEYIGTEKDEPTEPETETDTEK